MEWLKNKTYLNWGIFTLVAVVVIYYFGTRAGKASNSKNKQAEIDREIKNRDLTYELSQFSAFADILYNAMTGFTDDEDPIYSVIEKMRTRSDVLQLITAFGTQRIHFTIGNSNLNTWFAQRLSKSEIQKINKILSENQIDYTF